MKRLFSKKQRLALANASGWKCCICGDYLKDDFHADHIIPFSKGGATDVINGQALCASCNLKKGNKMSNIVLRDWQKEALFGIKTNFEEGKDKVLVQATPGGGKTILGLSTYAELKTNNNYTHVLIVVPSVVLQSQWQEDASSLFGIQLSKKMIYSGQPSFKDFDGMITTYQAINESSESFRMFVEENNVLVIADEIHHTSDGNNWGDSFKNATERAENVLMLTGTPWTSEGYEIPYVEYVDGFVKTIYSYGKATAIKDGICRVVEFNKQNIGEMVYKDDTYTSMEDAENNGKFGAYSHAVKKIETFWSMFSEADIQLSAIRAKNFKTGGGLIVAPDIETAHKIQDEISSYTGKMYEIVHSKAENAHKKIEDFRGSNERWLISVKMVAEGVDIKRLQVCIFLSTAKTELFFRQVIGRIERKRTTEDLGHVDDTAYFYCLNHPTLAEWILKIEDENKAGVAALKEAEEETKEESLSGTRILTENDLKEIELLNSELSARGIDLPDELVIKAYEIKKRNMHYRDLPMYVLCKIAKAELEENSEAEETQYQQKALPIEKQKENLKKKMQKEINRKIFNAGMGKQHGIHRDVIGSINRAVGIRSVDSASMEQLQKRVDYIYETDMSDWVGEYA